MDTTEEYLDAVLLVQLPEDSDTEERADYLSNHLGVPTDGYVEFRYPREETDVEADTEWHRTSGQYWRHTFPFRSVEREGEWFARPDAPKWKRHPVWKWENPNEDPNESITLSPSIGLQGENGLDFHCYIRDGEIQWL